MVDELIRNNGNVYHKLVNFIIARIEKLGGKITTAQLIDFTAEIQGKTYIFKIEILSQDIHSQLGDALNKIYEHAYLNHLDNDKAVIVINAKSSEELNWMYDYLEQDRNIRILWFDEDELYASPETRDRLAFLWGD